MVRVDFSDVRGLARSLIMYYGNPLRNRVQLRFYAQFIRPGDLCFDIGAHVGSRLSLWSRMGAHVVAVEPQPLFIRFLRLSYGRRRNLRLVEAALGAAPGVQEIYISRRTPTVTSLSPEWIEAMRQSPAFSGYEWDRVAQVPVLTLDQLIAVYGEPAFCKIDVEGYELEILKGLAQPLRCLSFEYIPRAAGMSLGCLTRLESLGRYEYNYTIGEQPRLRLERWASASVMSRLLESLDADDPSGDIYARRIIGET